jgi:WD40 repeat protein
MSSAGTAWRIAQFRPGNHPLTEMAKTLATPGILFHEIQKNGLPMRDIIATTLRLSKRGLIDIFQQASLDKDANLLLVVDQFEELFRYRFLGGELPSNSHEFGQESRAFVKLLLEVINHSALPIYVVLTMRSDFLGECTRFPGLAETINTCLYLVPRMSADERRDVIVKPVLVGGGRISSVLVNKLVTDVGENPDQLSILQHALNRTWDFWQKHGDGSAEICIPDYQAIGTMDNALDTHANEVYAELSQLGDQQPSGQQIACERIFKALTDLATDGRGVRRPTTLAMLCAVTQSSAAEVSDVINRFRRPDRSFLMPLLPEELRADSVIDISHESLMRLWNRLRSWAADEARSADQYLRLNRDAELHAQNQASLWRDPNLELALEWYETTQPNEAWASRYQPGFQRSIQFLLESKEEREKLREAAENARLVEKQRQERYIRILAFLTIIFAILTGLGWTLYQRAVNAQAQQYRANHMAQFTYDPLASVVNGLAAMSILKDKPDSFELAASLARAIDKNFEAFKAPSGHDLVTNLLELPDGRLLTVSDTGKVRLFNQDGSPESKVLDTKHSEITSLILLKNGDAIIGGQGSAILTRWRDGRAVDVITSSEQEMVYSLLALSDGTFLSGGWDQKLQQGKLQLWTSELKLLGKPLFINIGKLYSLALLGNGDVIIGGENGGIQRWRNGRLVGEPILSRQGRVTSLIPLVNDEFYSAGEDGSLLRWRNGETIGAPIKTSQGALWNLVQRSNGELVTAGRDGTLRRWKNNQPLDDGQPINTGQGIVRSLIELKKGPFKGDLISGGQDGSLRRWHMEPTMRATISTQQGKIFALSLLPNGVLVSAGESGGLKWWRDGKQIGNWIQPRQGAIKTLLTLRNGNLLSGDTHGLLRRWHGQNARGDVVQSLQYPIQILAELASGEVLIGGRSSLVLRLMHGSLIEPPIQSAEQSISGLLELEPADLLVAGSSSGSLQRIRNRDDAPIATNQKAILAMIKLPNGLVATGGDNGSIRVWAYTKNLKKFKSISTRQGSVLSLLLLTNGELLSGGSNGSLQRWSSKTFKTIGPQIPTGQGAVYSLIQMKNGDVISGGADGTLRRWMSPEQTIQAGCRELARHPVLAFPQTPPEVAARDICSPYAQGKR